MLQTDAALLLDQRAHVAAPWHLGPVLLNFLYHQGRQSLRSNGYGLRSCKARKGKHQHTSQEAQPEEGQPRADGVLHGLEPGFAPVGIVKQGLARAVGQCHADGRPGEPDQLHQRITPAIGAERVQGDDSHRQGQYGPPTPTFEGIHSLVLSSVEQRKSPPVLPRAGCRVNG